MQQSVVKKDERAFWNLYWYRVFLHLFRHYCLAFNRQGFSDSCIFMVDDPLFVTFWNDPQASVVNPSIIDS